MDLQTTLIVRKHENVTKGLYFCQARVKALKQYMSYIPLSMNIKVILISL